MMAKLNLIESPRMNLCHVETLCVTLGPDVGILPDIVARLMGFHIQYDSGIGRLEGARTILERSPKVKRISKLTVSYRESTRRRKLS